MGPESPFTGDYCIRYLTLNAVAACSLQTMDPENYQARVYVSCNELS